MKSLASRRRFLARGMGLGAGLLILPTPASARSYAANQRLNVAVVGHMYNAGHFLGAAHIYDGLDIVALCNADQRRVPETLESWEKRAASGDGQASAYYRRLVDDPPSVFSDPRVMYDRMLDKIDAVVVSTYDFTHGVLCGPAMRAGKHVFNERPLGLTIDDARRLREVAARHGVATSIRNPGNASGQFRRAVEIIRQGMIGPVEEVHIWFPRGGPDQQHPPQGEQPVPEGLNWDAWLGPLPWRPFHPAWMAYAHWRESSNGGLGSFGPHVANLGIMALNVHDLWQPELANRSSRTIRVWATSSRINRLSFPRWEDVRWHVPPRGDMPAVTFHWYHGPSDSFPPGARERILALMGEHGLAEEDIETVRIGNERLLHSAGIMICGTEGAIISDSHNANFIMLPDERFAGVQKARPENLPASPGHYNEWVNACRGGPPPWANFGYAGPLSEFLMLGNVATQFEDALEYDPREGAFLDHHEANQALGYEYRTGWTL